MIGTDAEVPNSPPLDPASFLLDQRRAIYEIKVNESQTICGFVAYTIVWIISDLELCMQEENREQFNSAALEALSRAGEHLRKTEQLMR